MSVFAVLVALSVTVSVLPTVKFPLFISTIKVSICQFVLSASSTIVWLSL
jgi:hypothetical protein